MALVKINKSGKGNHLGQKARDNRETAPGKTQL
jgi:hypothetical protein